MMQGDGKYVRAEQPDDFDGAKSAGISETIEDLVNAVCFGVMSVIVSDMSRMDDDVSVEERTHRRARGQCRRGQGRWLDSRNCKKKWRARLIVGWNIPLGRPRKTGSLGAPGQLLTPRAPANWILESCKNKGIEIRSRGSGKNVIFHVKKGKGLTSHRR